MTSRRGRIGKRWRQMKLQQWWQMLRRADWIGAISWWRVRCLVEVVMEMPYLSALTIEDAWLGDSSKLNSAKNNDNLIQTRRSNKY